MDTAEVRIWYLILLHSERPKLHTILAFLSAKGLRPTVFQLSQALGEPWLPEHKKVVEELPCDHIGTIVINWHSYMFDCSLSK